MMSPCFRAIPSISPPGPIQLVMKRYIPCSILAALAASGLSHGAETVYTNPAGYTTQRLETGFNLVGLTLQSPPVASGDFETVASNTLTDADMVFSPVAGRTYVLEISSGAALGYIQEVPATSISGNSITTLQDLSVLGLRANDTYKLRLAPTLEELFGTNTSILKKGATAVVADIVWIPDGAGGYNRYFLSILNVWRNAAGGAAPNVPVVYTDGFFVERKDVAVDFVFSGEVKTTPTVTVIATGFNLVGTIFPAGTTLQNLGLENNLKKGATAIAADLVWVPNGLGEYTRYFLNNLNVWRNAAGGAASADVPITSAVFIERKGGAANFDFIPPAYYAKP